MMIMCICYEPFDPFRAKERIVLRKEGSGLELQDLFKNISSVVSTSIPLLPCQLPVVNMIVILLVDRRGSENKSSLLHEIKELDVLAEMGG